MINLLRLINSNKYHCHHELFFIFGRLGFETICIAIADKILNIIPSPVIIKILYSNESGLKVFPPTFSNAINPAWKLYLKGDKYIIGKKITLISETLSKFIKNPPKSIKGIISNGTRAIAVYSLGMRAA